MNKKLTNHLKRFTVIIFAILAGLGVYLFNAQIIVGNQMPMPFGVGTAVILSGSMEPTLSTNDLVFVKEQERYQEGDIVVYQENDYLVIHRIIQMDGDTIQTKGDANNVADSPIDISSVRGKLMFRIPKAGVVVGILKTPVGIITILAVAIILMEKSFRKEKAQEDEKLEELRKEIRKLREEMDGEIK